MYCSSPIPVQLRTTDRPCTRHKQTCSNGPKSMYQVSLQQPHAHMMQAANHVLLFDRCHSTRASYVVAGSADVQRLWQTAAEAARQHISEVPCLKPLSRL